MTNIGRSKNELVLPYSKRIGWPWEKSEKFKSLPSNIDWPKITIVTPSLNQGQFLEATIRSVLMQEYPNLEYLIIDGGSTDESVEIIKKYAPWITYWKTGKDRGQSDAINKGFDKATGELLGWLNADDMYAPSALFAVAEKWVNYKPNLISGHSQFITAEGLLENERYKFLVPSVDDLLSLKANTVPQQSTFWSMDTWQKYGPLSIDNHFCMDWELWVRMVAGGVRWEIVDKDLAFFRHHSKQKTANISENLHRLAEKEVALRRFLETKDRSRRQVVLAKKGLDQVWIKKWKIKFRSSSKHQSPWRYWIKAIYQYPRCIFCRSYYGFLLRHIIPVKNKES